MDQSRTPQVTLSPASRGWALNLVLTGSLLAVLAGGLALRTLNQSLDDPGLIAGIEAQSRQGHATLAGLDLHLGRLRQNLMETRILAGKARKLAGLPDSPPVSLFDGQPRLPYTSGDLNPVLEQAVQDAASRTHFTLQEATALNHSLQQVVGRMEANAQAWARIPSHRPLKETRLTSGYGRRRDPFTGRLRWHHGVDWGAPRGTPVTASAAGVVTKAGRYTGYGRMVELDHGNGITTRYAHNSRLVVKKGSHVQRGEVIARVGSSGRASAPHLHYEVRLHGRPVNPEPYLLPAELLAE